MVFLGLISVLVFEYTNIGASFRGKQVQNQQNHALFFGRTKHSRQIAATLSAILNHTSSRVSCPQLKGTPP
jgi:hypothetical protein